MSKKCCSVEEKPVQKIVENHHDEHDGHDHSREHDEHGDDHDHTHDMEGKSTFQLFLPAIISFALLILGLAMDYWFKPDWFSGWIRLIWYVAAYIPVGLPVVKEA